MISQLDELKKYTTVITDTSDTGLIKGFTPRDMTTNPPLALKAM